MNNLVDFWSFFVYFETNVLQSHLLLGHVHLIIHLYHQYVFELHYIYEQYLLDDVGQDMGYQEKLFQESKSTTKKNNRIRLFQFIDSLSHQDVPDEK